MGAKVTGAASSTATRERILTYLQENHTATAAGLSRTWGLTRADIRYHLNLLHEEGLIQVVRREPNQALKRGRPTQTYRLAAQSTPDNLPRLCGALLGVLLDVNSPAEKASCLQALAESLAGSYNAGSGQGQKQNPVQQLNQVVAFLNQQAYRARWEAHASGPRLLLRSCPYAAVLKDHPELCEMDHLMIEKILQAQADHVTRMDLETGKPPACVFRIGTALVQDVKP